MTERRLQAPRQNSVEDSGLRGGRESTISITRSELTGSEPPGSRPDSVWSIAPRGGDYGGTDEEEEVEHDNAEEKSADRDETESDDEVAGYRALKRLFRERPRCHFCLGDVCLSSSR